MPIFTLNGSTCHSRKYLLWSIAGLGAIIISICGSAVSKSYSRVLAARKLINVYDAFIGYDRPHWMDFIPVREPEWAAPWLCSVLEISFYSPTGTFSDADAGLLEKFPEIEHLYAPSNMTDAGMDHVVSLKHLKWLNLDNTCITDDGLKKIYRLTCLEHLSVANARHLENKYNIFITNKSMEYISKLPHLNHLAISGTQVGDMGMAHLTQLSALDTLDVAGTGISDCGVVEIAKMTSLVDLDLSHCRLSSAIVPLLNNMPNLETVVIGYVYHRDKNTTRTVPIVPANCIAELAGYLNSLQER